MTSWNRALAVAVLSVATPSAAQTDPPTRAVASPMSVRAFRLGPGADLEKELSRIARENDLRAGVVLTCVGSLTRAVIRLADQPAATTFDGKREIVSSVDI
jgi:predicted DNA-binding protein with PD1-like motif